MLGIISAAYHEFESRINFIDDKLPAIKQVRRAVKEKIRKFTKSEIMELVPSIEKVRDVIEWKLDEVLDINGWDIRKALQLLHNSNPTVFE